MQQAATGDTTAWPPGGDRLRLWENQRMLCSFPLMFGTHYTLPGLTGRIHGREHAPYGREHGHHFGLVLAARQYGCQKMTPVFTGRVPGSVYRRLVRLSATGWQLNSHEGSTVQHRSYVVTEGLRNAAARASQGPSRAL